MANIDVYSLTLPNDDNAYWLKDKSLQDAKGAANGIAELDSTGKVPSSQLPEIPSGGHTIKNSAGTSMTQRENLQFVDATVSDDSTNDITKVENVRIINSESELTNAPDGLYMGSYDDAGDAIEASDVEYSNTTSGMASTDVQSAIDEIVAMKGANSGLAELDAAGKVPSSQLPSYVDDVIEVADYSHLPITGETGKIYVTLDDNKTYRWSGSAYVEISESLALGETSSTAYAGDKGKANADNITTIQGLIPSGATTSNKLATANDIPDISGKADKVTSATNGNLAGLNGSGNLTDSGWASDKTTTSASGNPISITGLKSNQLAVNPMITFEPIQAGSGDPSPSNVRAISGYDKIEVLSCGKNILEGEIANCAINNNGLIYASLTTKMGYAKVGQGKTYTVKTDDSTLIGGLFLTKPAVGSSTYNGARIVGAAGDYTFTAPITGYIAFRCTSAYTTLQIEEGSTSTTYEAPNKTTDLSESLGQTVYGGSLDIRTGKLTVEFVKKVYDGSSDETWTKDGQSFYIAENTLPKESTYTTNIIKCDRLQTVERSSLIGTGEVTNAISGYKDTSSSYPNQNWIYIGISGISDVASLKTWLSNNPIEVTFKVINSAQTTIQLTPHEISLLKDYAYVSTNGTSMSFDYHNGEIATLGDVAQLGETVNLIGEKVEFEDVSQYFVKDNTSINSANISAYRIGKMVFISGSLTPNTLSSLQNKLLVNITNDKILPLSGNIPITGIYIPIITQSGTSYPILLSINKLNKRIKTDDNGAYGAITNITTNSFITFSAAYVCQG